MDINWTEIKQEMKRDFANIFLQNVPAYPNVDEGIALFQKVIYSNIGGFELGGLTRTLPAALDEAYTSKVGQITPLKIIADSFEPYLKKICIIANLGDTASILAIHGLMPLLKLANLNTLLSGPNASQPRLERANISAFIGQPEYLEFICEAYLTRNEVHLSPDWNRSQVLNKLVSLLVVYVYAALKYRTHIQILPEVKPENEQITEKINNEQKYLYHFISFGSTTNKIRNQIVASYILNFLKENQPTTIQRIQGAVNGFFRNDMDLSYYQNLIQNLVKEGKVSYLKETKQVSLTQDELKRIAYAQSDFEENRNIFFLFLEDIAKRYNISNCLSELFDKLQEFIQNNYTIDMAEAYNRGIEVQTDDRQAYQAFSDYLQSLTPDRATANNLFKDLIELSRDSDFLIRMCASKAFASLTNPDRFDQYMHIQEKEVYLDTQVILFALCLDYAEDVEYDNFFYKTTEELFKLAKKNRNIRIKVSRLYLQEAAYQLKLALLLIPFEGANSKNLSSNVFYQFFWHLKENNLLYETDTTFAEFMGNWFRLYEDDAYDPKFMNIAVNILSEILSSNELNIEIEVFPTYDNKYEAVDILTRVLVQEGNKHRPKHSTDNDALMMCHLCNGDLHNVEPFFLTWDKTFLNFRKEFLNKYRRGNLLSFHLFNPAKFINHFSLINLKINPQAITDDFLSIMESQSLYEKTQTVWDAANKFLNIDNIDSQKRRRYVGVIKNLFESELDYTSEDIDDIEKTSRVAYSFEDVISKVNEYYNKESKFTITDYRNLLLAEEYFDKVSRLIFENVTALDNESSLLPRIDVLIGEFKAQQNN